MDQMGIGPAVAIPKLLKKVGLDKNEVDFYEVGAQALSLTDASLIINI